MNLDFPVVPVGPLIYLTFVTSLYSATNVRNS